MRKVLRFAAVAALFALPLASCDCDTKVTQAQAGIEVTPAAGTFGTVCADSESTETFTVTNIGQGTLMAELAIEGRDASFFEVEPKAVSVDTAGGSATVRVKYKPTGEGRGDRHEARLVITSNGSDEPITKVLSGDVADVDPIPVLSFGCADFLPLCDDAEREPCCLTSSEANRRTTRNLNFGDPVFDNEVATARLVVRNLGCGTLEVNEVRLEKQALTDTCAAYVPDGETEPVEQIVVKDFEPFTVGGTVDPNDDSKVQTGYIDFEFTPVKAECNVGRKYVLVTNDPASPPDDEGVTSVGKAAGTLSGRSSQGMLLISPDGTFSRVRQGEKKSLEFTIRNASPQDVHVDRVSIEPRRGSDGNEMDGLDLFRITKVTQCGDTKSISDTDTLIQKSSGKMEETACAEGHRDRLRVTVEYNPSRPGIHNAVLKLHHETSSQPYTLHNLSGRSEPKTVVYANPLAFGPVDLGDDQTVCSPDGKTCLSSECSATCSNDDQCDVTLLDDACVGGICSATTVLCTPACGSISRPVRICNEGIADLNIESLELFADQDLNDPPMDLSVRGQPPTPLFTLAGSCDGKMLRPDECCEETVTFQDSRVGGQSSAVIRINSDDPGWISSGGYFIDIMTQTTGEGRTPVAVIEKPEFPRVGSWVRLDGSSSTVGLGEISKYKWTLKTVQTSSSMPQGEIDPVDPNKNCPAANGGQCFRLSGEKNEILEFWTNDSAGLSYTFELEVEGSLCAIPWTGVQSETFRLNEREG